jgi:dihydropteroate synthase
MIFRACQFEFVFPRPAVIMGIVNVTPDSFSDGGRFLDRAQAVDHALMMIAEGAEIVDVGGESTRPGADPVGEAEELARVIPVIEGLAGRIAVPISIDTQKPTVARAALQAGASIVNDIAANRAPDEMWKIVAETGAGYVAMHMQGTPQTMQINPTYQNVVAEVREFFSERLAKLRAAGIPPENVMLDVGIGFGKKFEHNLELLRRLKDFSDLERPMLLGVSRKSFLGRLAGSSDIADRLPAALACACWAVRCGVGVIRTHDVSATLQAVRMMEELGAQPR